MNPDPVGLATLWRIRNQVSLKLPADTHLTSCACQSGACAAVHDDETAGPSPAAPRRRPLLAAATHPPSLRPVPVRAAHVPLCMMMTAAPWPAALVGNAHPSPILTSCVCQSCACAAVHDYDGRRPLLTAVMHSPPPLHLTSCACQSGACAAVHDDAGRLPPAGGPCLRPPRRRGRGRRRRAGPPGAAARPAPPPASSGCSPGCPPAGRSPPLQSIEIE